MGTSTTVYLGRDEVLKNKVIIKVIPSGDSSQVKSMDAEIRVGIGISQRCVFLVKYKEIIIKAGQNFIIMEYCSMGDLSKLIQNRINSNSPFSDELIFQIVFDVGNAVKALHDENIIHRDLKPDNIFQATDKLFKVGDFGISRSISASCNKTTLVMASIGYASPEVLDGETKLSKTMDIYSLGCIMLEVIDLCHPFAEENHIIRQSRILGGQVNKAKRTLSPGVTCVRDFALRMISTDPTVRPLIAELLLLLPIITFATSQYITCLQSPNAGAIVRSDTNNNTNGSGRAEEQIKRLEKERNDAVRESKRLVGERDRMADDNKKLRAENENLQKRLERTSNSLPAFVNICVRFLPHQTVTDVTITGATLIRNKNNDNRNFFFLDKEMTSGTFKISFESEGNDVGRACGLAQRSAIQNFTAEIGASLGSCQIVSDQIWCGLDIVYEKSRLYSRDGKQTISLELCAHGGQGILYVFANGTQLPHSVTKIPAAVHFVVRVWGESLVRVLSFQQLAASTANSQTQCAEYVWR